MMTELRFLCELSLLGKKKPYREAKEGEGQNKEIFRLCYLMVRKEKNKNKTQWSAASFKSE